MKGSLSVFILLACIAVAHADPRQWQGLGFPQRQSTDVQFWSDHQVASDDAGRVIAVWTDDRDGNYSVYGQLADINGNLLWDSAGAVICAEPHQQDWPVVTATEDGFVAVWMDYRSDPYSDIGGQGGDVRAQKISVAGNILWTAENSTGVPVDVTTAAVTNLLGAFSDGSGGAMIVWTDLSAGGQVPGISVQRVNSAGSNVFPQPLRFAADSSLMNNSQACAADSGGIYVAWITSANNRQTLRLNRINTDGQRLWGDEGMAVLPTGLYYTPYLVSDGEGGCYVAVLDTARLVTMQHVSSSGQLLWGLSGLHAPIIANEGNLSLTASMNGGATDGCFVATSIYNQEIYGDNSYIQKVSLIGQGLWGSSGQLICDQTGDSWNPRLASDSSGGVIIVRSDAHGLNGPSGCKLSRFNHLGVSLWPSCEMLAITNHWLMPIAPPFVHVQTGRIVVAGYESSNCSSNAANARFQVLDFSNGSRLMADSGVAFILNRGGGYGTSYVLPLSPGRMLFCWGDYRSGISNSYYQIIHPDRSLERAPEGDPIILVPDSVRGTRVEAICADGNGGAFVALYTGTYHHNWGRLTRIDNSGERVGPTDGVLFTAGEDTSDIGSFMLAGDGSGGCFLGWMDYRTGLRRFRLQRYSPTLQPLWGTPTIIDTNDVGWLEPSLNGTCILLTFGNSPPRTVRARKIDAQGQTVWNTVLFDSVAGDVSDILVVADRVGGIYIGESDQRFSGINSQDVFAQHLTSDGVVSWTRNGVSVRRGNGNHYLQGAAVDSHNNFYLGWWDTGTDASPGYQLTVQRIRPDSTFCWSDSGLAIAVGETGGSTPQYAMDAHDHLTVAWISSPVDYNYEHVRGTQLDSTGQPTDPYWISGEGNAIADTMSRTQLCQLIPDTGGSVLVLYNRYPVGGRTYGDYSLYAQLLADEPFNRSRSQTATPAAYVLFPAAPNPFNPVTQIRFTLAKSGLTSLTIFDILGRRVTTVLSTPMSAGEHSVLFDASHLASGIYFYRLESGSFSSTKKMVLLK